ncbi:amino acid ABC transporter permease [Motiliproteus sp. MSK22-1]|uniref:amino acid ABC transporter permease n=1 Tax=Motiliproteus sp. MSK22-1 TaxID=1897630 RepID=UPI000977701D|nr:amino acid ABC transporter permease [Motiliproteus sp. MSK22-1]OMH33865.1 amino acid ABC transporter [Motiliproteus sp. MSK22-1]
MSSDASAIQFFSGFQVNDLWFLAEAAGGTLLISAIAISVGTFFGCLFGWALTASRWTSLTLGSVLDVFRSVPLIIQLLLFFNFFPIIGLPIDPFAAGSIVLIFYTSALVAQVARGGIEAVPASMRRASRSLGMTYWQDMRYVVWPVGLRAVLPAWAGVALGVLKDSALVSVLGYLELLRASQILITRTQEPFIILSIVGLFYFALSYPISKTTAKLEQRWQYD